MHKQKSIKHMHSHIYTTHCKHTRMRAHTHTHTHTRPYTHAHNQPEGETGRESVQGQPSLLSQGRVNIPASTKPLTCLGRPAESLLSASRPTPHLNAMLLIEPLSLSPPFSPVHLHMQNHDLKYAESLSVTNLHTVQSLVPVNKKRKRKEKRTSHVALHHDSVVWFTWLLVTSTHLTVRVEWLWDSLSCSDLIWHKIYCK